MRSSKLRVEEALPSGVVDAVGVERAVEAGQRVPPALDVRVVAREQAQLGARLPHDPARVLVGIGRDAHLAPDVARRRQLQLLQARLVLAERLLGGVEVAQEARAARMRPAR